MKQVLTLSRKELCETLGIKPKSLQSIELRGNLERRLNLIDFRLIEKIKKGRNNYYVLELIEDISKMSDIEFCNYKKIKKIEKFKIHTMCRKLHIEGCINLLTKTTFSYVIGENIYQVSKFDKALMEERFMEQEGFVYLAYKDGECREVEKWEYMEFWKNNAHVKRMLDILVDALMDGSINKHEFKADYDRIIIDLGRKGEIYHKIPTYKKDVNFDMLSEKLKTDAEIKL